MNLDCPRWDDVSAAVDGELAPASAEAALAHARRCAHCRLLLELPPASGTAGRGATLRAVPDNDAGLPVDSALTGAERRWLHDRVGRVLLAGVALVIIGSGLPNYLEPAGSDGAASHTLRHVASWQIAFGIGLLVAAWLSRFSHALLALATAFVALTLTASVVDLLSGHRGPLAEWVHLVELVAVVLLWRMTPPHLRPSWRDARRRWRRPTAQRPSGAGWWAPLRSVREPGDERPGLR